MTEAEIIVTLNIPEASSHPAWSAFVRQMAKRLYGREPLCSAWVSFCEGWEESKAAEAALKDLTMVELEALETHAASSGTDTPIFLRDKILRACAEIRRRRGSWV